MTQPITESRRSGPDVASLLVELGRLLRACQFYDQGHPTLAESFRRTLQAFGGEIMRGGPLELRIEGGSFAFEGGRLASHVLDEVAGELARRRLRGFRLGAPLDPDAFAAFVQVASMDPAALEASGGPRCTLARFLVEGIEIEEDAPGDPSGEERDGEAQPAEEIEPGALQPATDREAEEGDTPELGFAPEETPFQTLLLELEACEDSACYARLTDRVVEAAERAACTGHPEQAYEAVLTARNHSGDDHKRSAHQRKMARAMHRQLLSGAALAEVIERSCSEDPRTSVEASSLLLEAGERIVPALLDRLDRAEDGERRDRLRSVLLAMGEDASQPLLEAMAGNDRRLARGAVRLCGELQHPNAVQWLEDLVAGTDAVLRQEAVMALARITGQASLQALLRVLESPVREVQLLTVQALGASGRPKAVPPLAERLMRDLEADDHELAREAIRALGRLGGPEAVPALGEVLERRRLFGRGRLRELKLAAIAALARVPGELAARELERAAQDRDPGLRRAAEAARRRRGAVDHQDDAG
jgi:HEAT repeat protein